jgi:hypothetical protein
MDRREFSKSIGVSLIGSRLGLTPLACLTVMNASTRTASRTP